SSPRLLRRTSIRGRTVPSPISRPRRGSETATRRCSRPDHATGHNEIAQPMTDPVTATIPLGDLKLYDSYIPALDAGNWRIEVVHTLTDSANNAINEDALGAKQEFV